MEFADATTLASVAEVMKTPAKGVAIAMNGEIIHREEWANTILKEGDDILVIKAFCGG